MELRVPEAAADAAYATLIDRDSVQAGNVLACAALIQPGIRYLKQNWKESLLQLESSYQRWQRRTRLNW